MLRILSLCLMAALAFVLLPAATATARTLRGEVTYRERIALDAQAVVTVSLVERSAAGAPGKVITSQTIRPRGRQVPISFRLNYPRRLIARDAAYALEANIALGDTLLFSTSEAIAVEPLKTTGPVTIVVNGVPAPALVKDGLTTPAGALQGTEWRAQAIGGRPVLDTAPATLSVEAGGRISGSAGCNRYFGTASVKDGIISVGPLGTTRMACMPDQMEQEKGFLDAIAKTHGFQVDKGQLVLLDAEGKPLMQLVRNDES
ncbi:META domain-containing protein [Kaistia adipata]|uniref:META domain-containing protein n=1 Tax=Kaistia adipata TaxID=166954 RepID=UPI000401DCBF|nr:META domain-containing protein [Kaistia adipata]